MKNRIYRSIVFVLWFAVLCLFYYSKRTREPSAMIVRPPEMFTKAVSVQQDSVVYLIGTPEFEVEFIAYPSDTLKSLTIRAGGKVLYDWVIFRDFEERGPVHIDRGAWQEFFYRKVVPHELSSFGAPPKPASKDYQIDDSTSLLSPRRK